jgi:hypothetical protein
MRIRDAMRERSDDCLGSNESALEEEIRRRGQRELSGKENEGNWWSTMTAVIEIIVE